ncbi:PspC domain-containing protein [Flavobacterium sp. CS20]|uniref:PspC domain-containing protein n=1 Tax=Flavobacterium sp. CS20 TaxID=2775246 RepID=UPI001B39D14F|nr:PspC domain-containing protein [Flavobacterium sp. CS20]QTY27040.1 PspC domain-containing protein [Flavobacterium sp. CS20]
MNKTLDINIANQIFHIDENAYKVLKNYLDAIKSYLANEASRDEIIQDIESRIAELFIERMISDKQVITTEDVNEIIKIMGEPKDYSISDDEDNQHSQAYQKVEKKLYRDKDQSYISGVSAGLAHYLGIDVVWVRLSWILFAILSFGWAILIYILFWILVPEAKTTAEKLAMKGEPINLSNIEKKIKESYDNVSEKIKDVDVKKHSKRVQSSISSFFSELENIIIKIGKVLVKIIGFVLMLFSGLGLLSLIFVALGLGGDSLFGSFDLIDYEIIRLDGLIYNGVPAWLVIVSSFIAIAVPLILIFILSLRLLFSNLKRVSKTFVISISVLWFLSIVSLIFIGINSSLRERVSGEIVNTTSLNIKPQDTLFIKMKGNLNYTVSPFKKNQEKITYDENDKRILYNSNVDVKFNHTSDNNAYIRISKWTYAFDENKARNQAKLITYNYQIDDDQISLNSYFLSPKELNDNYLGVDIDIYIPEYVKISLDKNTDNFVENYFHPLESESKYDEIYVLNDDKLWCASCEKIEPSGNPKE